MPECYAPKLERANLQAAVEASRPDGKVIWRGFDKLLDGLESMKWRKDIGSMTEPFTQEQAALTKRGQFKEMIKTVSSPGQLLEFGEKHLGTIDRRLRARGLAEMLTDPNSVEMLKQAAALPTKSARLGTLAGRIILLTLPASQQK